MQGYSPKLPLTIDSLDGAYSLLKTKAESIKQDLKMLVLTNPGERIMLPDYGVGIRQFLFSQNIEGIREEILKRMQDQIRRYMAFVMIQDLKVESSSDSNLINITIDYYIPSLNVLEQLIFSADSN